MKSIVLGLSLILVCFTAAGENAVPGGEPAAPGADAETLFPWLLSPPSLFFEPWSVPPSDPQPVQAPAPQVDPHALIRAASRKHRVPAAFITSIVAAESNFDPAAVSPRGAIGFMQLMPETAQMFGADAKVPEQNVDAGTSYLRFLIDKYHKYRNWLTRVIAAYNAGPAVVDRYHGVPPYRETKTYVARVLAFLRKFERQPA